MKTKRFLGLILIVFSFFLLVGCKKSPVVDFWKAYENAVNSHDLDAVASKFAITEDTVKQYKENHADYFDNISKIETSAIQIVTECNFSSKLYTNNYYLLAVKAKVNGTEMVFAAYIREENNGMFFTSDFTFGEDGSFGNLPDDLWLKSAYFTTDEMQYKFDVGSPSCTFVKATKNPREFVVPEEIDGVKVATIYNYAFYKNNKILSFTLPNSKLRKVTLPETITSINDYAFYQCIKLKELTIPKKVSYIGALALAGCRSMETIYFNQESLELEEPLKEIKESDSSQFAIYGGREMLIGDIITLTSNLTNVTWSTSSTTVQVDSDTGQVLALSEGQATINAIGVNEAKKKVQASITLTVKACPVVLKINFDALDRLPKLKNIYLNVTNPNSIVIQNGTNKFSLSTKVRIYVPEGTAELFKAHSSWAQYSDQIVEY